MNKLLVIHDCQGNGIKGFDKVFIHPHLIYVTTRDGTRAHNLLCYNHLLSINLPHMNRTIVTTTGKYVCSVVADNQLGDLKGEDYLRNVIFLFLENNEIRR